MTKWVLDIINKELIGNYTVRIKAYSDVTNDAPIHWLPDIALEILPCMVVSVDVANSNLVDFEMYLGETKTFPFEQYVQSPSCEYDVRYTVTLIEAS